MYWPGKSAAVAGHEWIHRTFFQTTEMKVLNVAVRAIAPGVAVAVAQTKMGAFMPPDGVRRPKPKIACHSFWPRGMGDGKLHMATTR
jgi:hypothetical protein